MSAASDSPVVCAPGKLILMGEYAVVEGGPGVAMAVDRLVTLHTSNNGRDFDTGPDLVSFARTETAARLGLPPGKATYVADSDQLMRDGVKLGLGSSAAVTVCAVASVLAENGEDVNEQNSRRLMWGLAKEIHDVFQGSRGSGLDIAASLFGGCIAMKSEKAGIVPVIEPFAISQDVQFEFAWTGSGASSPDLVGHIRTFGKSDPTAYRDIIGRMSDTAGRFVTHGPLAASVVIEAFEGYARLMDELGRTARVPIVTDAMAAVFAAARKAGGAAKPSGAGYGDFVVAAFPADCDAEGFRDAARRTGMTPMKFEPAPHGVRSTINRITGGSGA